MISRVKNWFQNLSTTQKVIVVAFALMLLVFLMERVVYGIFYFNSIQDGMTIFISPVDELKEVGRGDTFQISFNTRVQNLPLCTATCQWELEDFGTNTVVSEGEERFQQGFGREFTFSTTATQQRTVKPYKLTVQCNNQQTRYCRGTSSSSSATTLINVTYQEEELEPASYVNENYASIARQWFSNLQLLQDLQTIQDDRIQIQNQTSQEIQNVRQLITELEENIRNDEVINAYNLLRQGPSFTSLDSYRQARTTEREIVQTYNDIIRDVDLLHAHFLIYENTTRFRSYLDLLHSTQNNFETQSLSQSQSNLQGFQNFTNTLNTTNLIQNANTSRLHAAENEQVVCSIKNATCQQVNETTPQTLLNSCEYLQNYNDRVDSLQEEFATKLRPNQTLQQTLNEFNVTSIRERSDFNTIQQGVIEDARNNELNTSNTSLMLAVMPELTRESQDFTQRVCSKNFPHQYNFLNASLRELNKTQEYTLVDLPTQRCCNLGECRQCMSEEKTPILLVHGHAIAESSQPEYSIQAMSNLANTLEQNGYYYFGHVFPERNVEVAQNSVLNKLPNNFVFTTTYYTDSFAEEGEYYRLVTKSEPIETYGIRLSEAVDKVLAKTGQDKVDIIAHSMGGLVTRSYLQNFGDDKVRKTVLIGTPNHGVSGRTARFCNIFGSENACRDMTGGSQFLNSVNSHTPNIPVLNVIGVGCQDSEYDGIVFRDEVELEWAENKVYEGNCEGAFTLHSKLNRPRFMPNVYDDIIEFLEN